MGGGGSKEEGTNVEWFDEDEFHDKWKRRVSVLGQRRRSSILADGVSALLERGDSENKDGGGEGDGRSERDGGEQNKATLDAKKGVRKGSVVLFGAHRQKGGSEVGEGGFGARLQNFQSKRSARTSGGGSQFSSLANQSEMSPTKGGVGGGGGERKRRVTRVKFEETDALQKELVKNDDLKDLRKKDFRLHETMYENALYIVELKAKLAKAEDRAQQALLGYETAMVADKKEEKNRLEAMKEEVLQLREESKKKKMELQTLREMKISAEMNMQEEKTQLEKRIEEVKALIAPFKNKRVEEEMMRIDERKREEERIAKEGVSSAIGRTADFLKALEEGGYD
mmetsp:Transcript_46880/g.120836  ORF Transcript_46880/g.120836 Transcript_46880/m.120836 type:complete len:340 (-) Transcript_46880:1640-2659(-)